jgi:hypothetical protein
MTEKKTDFQKTMEVLKASSAISTISEKMARVKPMELGRFGMGNIEIPIIEIPSQEEVNGYQSAGVMMKAISESALAWKTQLPDAYQPAVMALLYGGVQIQVETLAQVSFHGIQIQGMLSGAQCSMLAHQSTVQILCYAQEITEENPRNPIGFIWADNKVEV